ncbi:hypothetical protein SNEBB_010129 [Seison nebaliae]|nr:hypothetical protein SNEBB_010129 [Seison nebaliae]
MFTFLANTDENDDNDDNDQVLELFSGTELQFRHNHQMDDGGDDGKVANISKALLSKCEEEISGLIHNENLQSITQLKIEPENDLGNCEYKLRLMRLSSNRLEHLKTQMKWRIAEGKGVAFYRLGVADNGQLIGLTKKELIESYANIVRLSDSLHTNHIINNFAQIKKKKKYIIYFKISNRLPSTNTSNQLEPSQSNNLIKIALLGASQSGKTTLCSTMIYNDLDDGKGSSRLNLFRHRHEIRTGVTSSISVERLYSKYHKNATVLLIDLAGDRKYYNITLFGLTSYHPDYALLCISNQLKDNIDNFELINQHFTLAKSLSIPIIICVTKVDDTSQISKEILKFIDNLLNSSNVNSTNKNNLDSIRYHILTSNNHLDDDDDDVDENLQKLIKNCSLDLFNNPSEYFPIIPISCISGRNIQSILVPFLFELKLQRPILDKMNNLPSEFEIYDCFTNHFRYSERRKRRPTETPSMLNIASIDHSNHHHKPKNNNNNNNNSNFIEKKLMNDGIIIGGVVRRGIIHNGDRMFLGPCEIQINSTMDHLAESMSLILGSRKRRKCQVMAQPRRQYELIEIIVENIHISKKCVPFASSGQLASLLIKVCPTDAYFPSSYHANSPGDIITSRKLNLFIRHGMRLIHPILLDATMNNDWKIRRIHSSDDIHQAENIHVGICWVFEANILLLDYHSKNESLNDRERSAGIEVGFECKLFLNSVNQSATIINIELVDGKRDAPLITGSRATVQFRFNGRPEFVNLNGTFLFRASQTTGIGTVTNVIPINTIGITLKDEHVSVTKEAKAILYNRMRSVFINDPSQNRQFSVN